MVVEAFISVLVTVCTWVLGRLPDFAVPDWVLSAPGQVSQVAGTVGALSWWLPLSVMLPCAVVVLASAAVGLSIKLVRVVLSFFTAGGGSAG